MSDQPLISVIMPVYNGAGLLERAVESVRRQTYENWELLITDDGSTDNTAEVVEAVAAEEPRIRVFRLPENSGAGRGRNMALDQAKGEMVCYLDCDDEFYPLHLENIAALKHKGEVLVFCYDVLSPPNKDDFRKTYTWNPILAREGIFHRNISTPLGVAHHHQWTEAIGGFNPLLWREQDADVWRRMARSGAKFAYLPLKSGRYHVRASSISRAPHVADHQRRQIEENFQKVQPLYGEPRGAAPASVQAIACITPHCLLDAGTPAVAELANALQFLGTLGFTCRAACGSWFGTLESAGPEILAQQNLSSARRQVAIDDRRYRLLDTQCGEMPLTIFEDAPQAGRWSSNMAQRDFLTVCDYFLDQGRPDAVLTFGSEAATAAIFTMVKRRDIPVVHWLHESLVPNWEFFQKVDYLIVGSESRREQLWNERGLACYVLPGVTDAEEADNVASTYKGFFRNVWPQPGPPYVPRNSREHQEQPI